MEDVGRSGADAPSGHSAEPAPISVVAAQGASVPNADSGIESAALVHLAVRTERLAATAMWAGHRVELINIAQQLRVIARESRA